MFKKNKNYTLVRMKEEYYLLPFGQAVEDQKAGCMINEETAFLWDHLDETDDPDKLTDAFCNEYSISGEDKKEVRSMIRNVLTDMKFGGYLTDENRVSLAEPSLFNITIAGITVQLRGREELFHENLSSFRTGNGKYDLRFSATYRTPINRPNGSLIMRNDEIALTEAEAEYIVLFLNTAELKEARISKDMKNTLVYCNSPVTEAGVEIILNTLRYVFLMYVSVQDKYALHSVSVLYNDKLWLFSGPSGTGKTTHTNLWKKLFETEIINGDLNLIGFEDGEPVVYGTPWCGSSGIYSIKQYPLGGIVLLKQSEDNRVQYLSEDQKVLYLSARLISASTNSEQLKHSLQFISRLTETVPVFRLYCNMEDEAAVICRNEIDRLGE